MEIIIARECDIMFVTVDLYEQVSEDRQRADTLLRHHLYYRDYEKLYPLRPASRFSIASWDGRYLAIFAGIFSNVE